MKMTRYGIYSRHFGKTKYRFIKGYNTYYGAMKALKNARFLKLDGRSEVKIIPYTSYQPIIWCLFLLAAIIIAMKVL